MNIERVSLEFSDIDYFIKDKRVLSGIAGKIESNNLVGIIGPTGSGKTTLLNILSGKTKLQYRRIMIGHYNIGTTTLRKISSLIDRSCLLSEFNTVKEVLDFVYKAKGMKGEDVESAMELSGLTGIERRQIRSLSLEERKRVEICLGLSSSPTILYLDEPTVGLDYSGTVSIMKHLKSLTRDHTVVVSVHHELSRIIDYFDSLIVLNEGRVVYSGDKKSLPKFFESNGFNCPPNENHAEFLMANMLPSLVNSQTFEPTVESARKDFYIEANFNDEKNAIPTNFSVCQLLTKRNLIGILRNWTSLLTSLAIEIALIIMMLLAFTGEISKTSDDEQPNDTNITCIEWFSATLSTIIPIISSVTLACLLRGQNRLSMEERNNGYYNSKVYFLSCLMNGLIQTLLSVTIFCVPLEIICLEYPLKNLIIFILTLTILEMMGRLVMLIMLEVIDDDFLSIIVVVSSMLYVSIINRAYIGRGIEHDTLKKILSTLPFFSSTNLILKNHANFLGERYKEIINDKIGSLSMLTSFSFLFATCLFGMLVYFVAIGSRKYKPPMIMKMI